jgi:solute carrier family 20 (sodium-dependent phosphate transporter)
MSAGIYSIIQYGIIKTPNAIQRSIYFLPFVVLFTVWIEFIFILSKGAGSRITWDIGTTVWVSLCIALGASGLSVGFIPFLQKKIVNYVVPEPAAIEDKAAEEVTTVVPTGHVDEVYDPRIEYSFAYLQIFTSICTSFAHGANDVSNAVGPLAAIWHIYQTGTVSSHNFLCFIFCFYDFKR